MASTQSTSAPIERPLSDHAAKILPVQLVLEVTRGSTRFRRRPVTNSRFLIGSGATCDLRVGGEGMPALHCIIATSGRDITLEAIAAAPALAVNGRVIQSVLLHDADLITIGDVELLARVETGHAPAGVEQGAGSAQPAIDDERAVSDLSAAELVDLIEREERAIEEFEGRQKVGMRALVQAIIARADKPAQKAAREPELRAPIPAPHFLSKRPQPLVARTRDAEHAIQDDIKKLGEQLSNLTHELKGNSQRATRREAHFASATDDLLSTQDKLVSQLEIVLDQVQTLKANETPIQKPRAIA